jgi:hypothetical protein
MGRYRQGDAGDSARVGEVIDRRNEHLAELEGGWDGKHFGKWLALPNPTSSWLGIGGWSPRSSMAQNTGNIQAAPPVSSEVKALVVRMARENSGWGYVRIVGALANLGHRLSDQSVKNILRCHGIAPAPKRSQVTSWKDFIAAHMNVLAGCDFFTR